MYVFLEVKSLFHNSSMPVQDMTVPLKCSLALSVTELFLAGKALGIFLSLSGYRFCVLVDELVLAGGNKCNEGSAYYIHCL